MVPLQPCQAAPRVGAGWGEKGVLGVPAGVHQGAGPGPRRPVSDSGPDEPWSEVRGSGSGKTPAPPHLLSPDARLPLLGPVLCPLAWGL